MRVLARMAAALCVALLLAAKADGQLYGIVSDTSELYIISQVDGTVELVGDAGDIYLAGLDYCRSDGFLYGFNAIDVYRVNPHDAAAAVVGPHGLTGLVQGGLAITPAGKAYGLNRQTTSAIAPDLFSIDLSSGQAQIIASLGSSHYGVTGLAWRNDDKLVGIDVPRNALLEIDPTTGENHVISFLSPSLGAVGGLAGDGQRGFFTTGPPVLGGANALYSIDFFSGEHSLIGSLGPTFEQSGITGLAFIPEPPGFGLGLTALLTGAAIARVRPRKVPLAHK